MADGAADERTQISQRRISRIAAHLDPTSSIYHSPFLRRCATASEEVDSYRRVHGEVAAHDVMWKEAEDDLGKPFSDIIYEKAVGEGIAKVLRVPTDKGLDY